MSNPTDTGVSDKNFSGNKGVCGKGGACRYCDAPQYFQSKINHKHFGIHI